MQQQQLLPLQLLLLLALLLAVLLLQQLEVPPASVGRGVRVQTVLEQPALQQLLLLVVS
jgi:hypothetical protein